MVAAWIAPVVKVAFTGWQVIATLATTAAIPPLGPVVAGVFSVAGSAIDQGFAGASQADGVSHEQFVQESLTSALRTLYQMNTTIYGVQQLLHSTAAETRQSLRDIQISLKTFEDNMNRNFDELQVFTIEKDFIENVELPLKKVWDLMKSASELQTKDSVHRFLLQFKMNTGRNILAEFINRLDYTHTNPIKIAMEKHVFDSRRIMDHYVQLFSHVLFKVLAIEGFYFGVADGPKDNYNSYVDGLTKDVDAAILAFRAFYSSYKIPIDAYWPNTIANTMESAFSAAAQKYLRGESALTNIADQLKQQLDGIRTTDMFSIFGYSCSPNIETGLRDCRPHLLDRFDHWNREEIQEKMAPFMILKDKHKLIADIVVIVLRSETFHNVTAQARSLLRDRFRSYATTMSAKRRKQCPTTTSPGFSDSLLFDIGTDPFLDVLDQHYEKNQVKGFVTCNKAPMVQRFTHNGTSILEPDDLTIIPAYYALTWK